MRGVFDLEPNEFQGEVFFLASRAGYMVVAVMLEGPK